MSHRQLPDEFRGTIRMMILMVVGMVFASIISGLFLSEPVSVVFLIPLFLVFGMWMWFTIRYYDPTRTTIPIVGNQ